MNNSFARRLSFLLSLAAITVVGSGLSVQAQTVDTGSTDGAAKSEEIAQPSVSLDQSSRSFLESPQVGTAPLFPESTNAAPQTPVELAEAPVPARDSQRSSQEAVSVIPESEPTEERAAASAPVPGTTATSADPLTSAAPVTPQVAPASEAAAPSVAQVDIDPGGATRGGSSYVGVGANIGLSGDSALGDFSFTVISKIGLTNRISARPSVVIGDDAVFLIPVTYDFSLLPVDAFEDPIPFSPYVGAGVAISTGDESDVGPMLSAGVDVPINTRFTATAAVNVGFLENTDVGLLLGVGYNFSGFGFF